MQGEYKIVYTGGMGELIEKKSRFIATVNPVSGEAEAAAFFDDVRKKNRNATHNCTAFTIGKNDEIMRSSDDGEPSGTAGRPMLEVLTGMGLHNVAVVVTRYFGGTLLGTGGLVRAYTCAVQTALANCVIVTKKPGVSMEIKADYTYLGKIQHIIRSMDLPEPDIIYEGEVVIKIVIPSEIRTIFREKISSATAGKIAVCSEKNVYFGSADGKIILFDD